MQFNQTEINTIKKIRKITVYDYYEESDAKDLETFFLRIGQLFDRREK